MDGDQFATLERRKNVAERYLRGQSQWQIGRSLEVSAATVNRDLAWVRKEWLASCIRDYDARKAQELAHIDLVEREAWAAWERSKSPRELTRTRRRQKPTTDKDGNPAASAEDEAEYRKEQRDGNPKFLEVALRCIEQRCKIFGLVTDAPGVSTVVTVINGVDLQVVVGDKPGIPYGNDGRNNGL